MEGSASGLVTVTMNGHGKVTGLKIKPEAVDPDDVEALEDLMLVALQDAGAKAEAPLWIQRSGFEWLHRLASEPRRLWRRWPQSCS